MSTTEASRAQELMWVQWWIQLKQFADPSWELSRIALARKRLPSRLLTFIEESAGPGMAGFVVSIVGFPPRPHPRLWPFMFASKGEIQRVLALIVTICAGQGARMREGLHPDDEVWCRRVGKALQPGQWLPQNWQVDDDDIFALRLLRAWVGNAIWERLRLQFSHPRIMQAERVIYEGLPARRLAALWQAVGWYAATQGEVDVDIPNVDA
ncbi:hypothetical protein [Pseudomonas fluorescens]|uniref:hypothetical protein n=1 Tax=Pseudomonas fluorescens TaxID=294 RepID=UPI001BE4ED24|nr:hypothetical protein [Pseudomonas fluorescens]MBT2375472.1 hypothetical protein [Pseudomonas fluorescens]